MDNPKRTYEIRTTGDGTHTLYIAEMDESYHSRHGALQESEYVFIQQGLKFFIESHPEASEIRILEVGLGTGLNAALTFTEASKQEKLVRYTGLEPYPIPAEIISELNYTDSETVKERFSSDTFASIHGQAFGEFEALSDFFELRKLKCRLEDFSNIGEQFDLIFFDAFAPGKQAELWKPEAIEICRDVLRKEGVLVTYCAQGQFRRDLKSLGFETERLPGPPGKKHMTRGVKL